MSNILLKIQLLLVLFGIFSCKINAQDYTFDWLQTAEGINQDFVNGMKSDSIGNVYIYGNFNDTLKLGQNSIVSGGDFDFFIAKYNANGEIVWIKESGGKGYDNVSSVDIDKYGNIYLAGSFMHSLIFGADTLVASLFLDNFLIKYSPEGNIIYAKNIGASSKTNEIFIKVLSDNNIILASSFYGTMNFQETILSSQGGSDIFLFKMDENGNIIDNKQIGGRGDIKLNDIIIDEFDNIYLTGYFKNTVLIDNEELTSAGKKDAFVLKYDTDLNLNWNKHIKCIFDVESVRASVNSSGFISIAGVFRDEIEIENKTYLRSNGSNDIFLIDYNTNGDLIDYRSIGGEMNEKVFTLNLEKDGTKILSGGFKGEINEKQFNIESQNQENDLFIGKIKVNNEFADLIKFGGKNQDYISSISKGKDSCIYMTGGFDDNFFFNDTIATGNIKDIFLIKLNKCSGKSKSNKKNTTEEEELLNEYFLAGNETMSDSDESKDDLNTDSEVSFENYNNIINVEVFPNPSNGIFNFRIENLEFSGEIFFEVYTIDGKLLLQKKAFSENSIHQENINIQDEPEGTYILKITSKEGVSITNLIKM